ncbi:hypothetical protein BCR43DRAFT_59971 [Syncephalastrum racemosum]|uniref:Uncharacterized protein n=1 Tax=Syncephalastrum racemosum TaxID=13706 RepID=A0A1X2HVY6_SYNRA|nr:hypothetical protein BCR43DRAFT_59971 [Syncephalastrum racemosum]
MQPSTIYQKLTFRRKISNAETCERESSYSSYIHGKGEKETYLDIDPGFGMAVSFPEPKKMQGKVIINAAVGVCVCVCVCGSSCNVSQARSRKGKPRPTAVFFLFS